MSGPRYSGRPKQTKQTDKTWCSETIPPILAIFFPRSLSLPALPYPPGISASLLFLARAAPAADKWQAPVMAALGG